MYQNRIKILFILPSLKAGGAERVMSFIADNLNEKWFDKKMIIVGYEEDKAFDVSNVDITFLNKSRVIFSFIDIIKIIKREKADIVIGSIGHINTLLAIISILFRKTKFIGRESSVSSIRQKFSSNNSFIGYIAQKNYKLLDAVICQSRDMYDDVRNLYNIDKNKCIVINNPISGNLSLKDSNNTDNQVKELITVGRLNKVKGHERILSVLAKLTYDWRYTIVGRGEEKDTLFDLIDRLGLKEKIRYIEFTNEVPKYLMESDLFLQGSYVEGFPNALLESCAVGTPAVVFNAPGGTKEIIEEDLNGYISENEEDFLQNVIKALELKDWNPLEIRNSVFSKFSKEIILNKYEELFKNLMEKKN
ncbi:glycosyltransferase [Aquimarina sp. RZ0]|uniref:glycosyltransferase n=1 Tax=Aquimarina sp. RZ0 TaxID=2607730 RepID=UPI0011F25005|nr:glycosyltransferase [Aquimarina sp. RZ0]KAA1246946.1 glycosyltransferase [Aquimarina sp. RZ0]